MPDTGRATPYRAAEHALQIGPLVFLWQHGRGHDGRRFWNVGVIWR